MFTSRKTLLLGFAMASLVGLGALGVAADRTAQDEPLGEVTESHRGGAFTKCAEACSDCQRECDACAQHCATLLAEGEKHHLVTLQTCRDCATLCTAAARIVSAGGVFSNLACGACADACARCANECETISSDKMMARCAEECHRCEKACRDMVKLATLK